MICKFAPVNNIHGFDIRELEIKNGEYKVIRWLDIRENYSTNLPTFKPKIHCVGNEWKSQFIPYYSAETP